MAIVVTSKPCTCDKCGAEAVSMSGTYHRRCTGQPRNSESDAPAMIRPKHDKLGVEFRGKWQ